jgi:GcrA cell cycle regulator
VKSLPTLASAATPSSASFPASTWRALCAASQAIVEQPIHDGHRCSLFELSEERCRWPINTPGAEDFCFCGNMPVEGLPYCAGHTRLAYRPNYHLRVARR